MGSYPLALLFSTYCRSLNKNTAPACGVADYEQTWEQFYDAANLRATYSFMQGAGAGYQGFTGRTGLGSAVAGLGLAPMGLLLRPKPLSSDETSESGAWSVGRL